MKEHLKDWLVERGFVEVMNYSFLSDLDLEAAHIESSDLLEVANPLQPENKYLRKSLVPGLLFTIAKNPTFDPLMIFEISDVFSKEGEFTRLALAVSGKNAQKIFNQTFDNLLNFSKSPEDLFARHELSREELNRFKIKKPVSYTLEVDFDELIKNIKVSDKELGLKLSAKVVNYRPISKFPAVTRDLAFIVDKDLDSEKVKETIYSVSDQINRVELFDEFISDKFGVGKKNMAFHLYLQQMDRTMIDKEADKIIDNVINTVREKFAALLRDK